MIITLASFKKGVAKTTSAIREYIIQERKGNKFKLLEESTGQINWLSEKELVQHFFAGQLNFQNKKTLPFKSVNHYHTADFSEIPESIKAEAQRKYNYVFTVLDQKVETYTSSFLTPIPTASCPKHF